MYANSSKFWDKVRKTPTCWLWTGASFRKGYGNFSWKFNGKVTNIGAHRFSYQLAHQVVLSRSQLVLHKCDTPACVRPAHLFVGTHDDNMRDMVHKGRHWVVPMPGEKNPSAKLTIKDVVEIRTRYRSGEFQRIIASDFGIRQNHVSRIVRNESWTGGCG